MADQVNIPIETPSCPPQEREYLGALDQLLQARKKLDLLSSKVDEELVKDGAQLQDMSGRQGTARRPPTRRRRGCCRR